MAYKLLVWGIAGSVGQPKDSKPGVLGSTPGSSCFYRELKNDISKHKKTILLFVLYKMYKSMTS